MPIAIQIKTFNRPQRLIPTVQSIRRYCDVPYRLYIGDDGPVSADTEALYEQLEREGHCVIRYPAPLNVTTARNDMVSRLGDEAYVLRLDDDFNFCAETRLGALRDVLAARPEIGAVSGLERQLGTGKNTRSNTISDKQGHLLLHDETLHKIYVPPAAWVYQQAGGVRFAYASFTRNFLMIRREVFEQVRWNDELVIQGEHAAFMMDLQQAGWALAFTPDSIHIHNETPLPDARGYAAARQSANGETQKQAVFRRAYGITRTVVHRPAAGKDKPVLARALMKPFGSIWPKRVHQGGE